jgi:lipopolysaccharide exporter
MLSLMTSPTVVGWYGVPTRLFQTLMFLPAIVGTAWLPQLVTAHGEGMPSLRRASRQPIALVVSLSLPVCAATVAGSAAVIGTLYGPAYTHAIPVMVLLGLCIPPMYLNIMLNQVLVAAGRQSTWTWAMLAAVVVNPLINLVLIRATEDAYGNGAIGAAASLVLTELMIVGIGLVLVGRGALDGLRSGRTGRVAVASAVLVAVTFATRPAGAIPSFAAGLAGFAVACLVLRLATPSEIRHAPATLRAVLRGGA